MKIQNKHYSNYLISVQFDNGFLPDTLSGKIEYCENFLKDLGKLARSHGRRLHATYSVVEGIAGYHAHFAVSWLPLVGERVKTAKKSRQTIARYTVTRLLDDNYFFVDNPKQAIKRVTHDKRYVTSYVIEQPKDGQSTIYSAFYVHINFVPIYLEIKMHPYCSKAQFGTFRKHPKKTKKTIRNLIVMISILEIALISILLLSLF